ncbi:hypothetical protein [Belnapia sp. F-4-1]|uniref:hypothetical protein n=1 Tax=Belnapia sp. F-4-1 TaxID=1545443 RepID=UPI001184E829|nr:hypothetical protein [Belnapia sp. F-4-1]
MVELRRNSAELAYCDDDIDRAKKIFEFLRAAGRLPARPEAVAAYITPLICRSTKEQKAFREQLISLLTSWKLRNEAPSESVTIGAPAHNIADSGRYEGERTEASDPSKRTPKHRRRSSHHWLRFLFLVTLLFALSITIGIMWDWTISEWIREPRSEERRPLLPGEGPDFERPFRTDHIILVLAPWTLVGAFALWRRSRQARLARHFSFRQLEEVLLKLGNRVESHFSPANIVRLSTALATRESSNQQQFDTNASVSTAIRFGGNGPAVFRPVLRQPEYLFLLRRDGKADHASYVGQDLIHRLGRSNVAIHAYEVRGSPTQLRVMRDLCFGSQPLTDNISEVVSLGDVLNSKMYAGVVIFGDGASYAAVGFDGSPGALLSVLSRKVVLSPKPVSAWGESEILLSESGFALFPADSAGLFSLSEWIAQNRELESGVPKIEEALRRYRVQRHKEFGSFPTLLRAVETRFLSHRPPERDLISELLGQLRTYLGRPSFTWLCALAVYPQIHASLTREFGKRLRLEASSTPVFSEQRYLVLARLPWVARGGMPDWLRRALVAKLDPGLAAQTRLIFAELFFQLTPSGRVNLQLAKAADRSWRDLVDALIHLAPKQSALHDQVLVTFLKDQQEQLSVKVPNLIVQLLNLAARTKLSVLASSTALISLILFMCRDVLVAEVVALATHRMNALTTLAFALWCVLKGGDWYYRAKFELISVNILLAMLFVLGLLGTSRSDQDGFVEYATLLALVSASLAIIGSIAGQQEEAKIAVCAHLLTQSDKWQGLIRWNFGPQWYLGGYSIIISLFVATFAVTIVLEDVFSVSRLDNLGQLNGLFTVYIYFILLVAFSALALRKILNLARNYMVAATAFISFLMSGAAFAVGSTIFVLGTLDEFVFRPAPEGGSTLHGWLRPQTYVCVVALIEACVLPGLISRLADRKILDVGLIAVYFATSAAAVCLIQTLVIGGAFLFLPDVEDMSFLEIFVPSILAIVWTLNPMSVAILTGSTLHLQNFMELGYLRKRSQKLIGATASGLALVGPLVGMLAVSLTVLGLIKLDMFDKEKIGWLVSSVVTSFVWFPIMFIHSYISIAPMVFSLRLRHPLSPKS